MFARKNQREAKPSSDSSDKSPAAGIAARVAVLFIALAAVVVIAHAFVSRSVVHDEDLAWWLRATLVCRELALLGVVLIVGALVSRLSSRVTRRWSLARRPIVRVAGHVLCLWAVLFLYAASWGAFRFLGVFGGVDALRMFANDPVQLAQHAAQLSLIALVAVPAVVLLLALAAVCGLPRWTGGWSGAARARWVVGAGVFALACVVGAFVGDVAAARSRETLVDDRSGVIYSLSDRYRIACAERVGPLSTLLADGLRAVTSPRGRSAIDPAELRRRPVVSMDEYLDGVERSAIAKRNVIVILIESLRSDQLPSFGGRRNVLPALEKVARDGRIFRNAYAQSSHSNYADLPPLSSHYPLRTPRTHFYPRDPSYPRVLLYDVLKPLGYATAIISSQNENWGSMLNYLDTGNVDKILHAENYDGPVDVPRVEGGFEKWMLGDRRAGKIDDRFTVREAIDWIRGRKGQPFFLYMNLQSSHFPYEIPVDFPRRFSEPGVNLPDMLGRGAAPENPQVIRDLYSDSLSYLDAQLDKLFTCLREEGIWDETIIVASADTATAFLEHGSIGNGAQLFNEVVKVPLIVRAPGLERGVEDRVVEHVDVPPSILDLIGLPRHPAFQGRSFVADELDSKRPVYLVSQTPLAHQYAVIDEGWKLIFDVRHNRHSLYHLDNDPGELFDLSRAESEKSWELMQKLLRWESLQLSYYEDESLHGEFYPPLAPR